MKILDVIKSLTENTSETFENNGWKAHIENGAIVFDNDKYPIIEINLNDNWQPVRQSVWQPITWQEAIQAWVEGKTVTVSTMFGLGSREVKKSRGSSITEYEITKGTWYVED